MRGEVSPLWPATGVALVALLLLGLRAAPGIMIGALFANWLTGSLGPAVVISVGNTLAACTAYALLRRAGFRTELDRLRDGLALVFLGAFAGMLVSASIGTGVLLATGDISSHHIVSTWLVWWTGDAMGVLVFAPLLLVFAPHVIGPRAFRWVHTVSAASWVQAGLLLVGSYVATAVATRFTGGLFIGLLFVGWAALRFQLVGAAPCAVLVSIVAIDASVQSYGPFRDEPLVVNMIALQIFNCSVALVALLLSVIISERNRARTDIERTCAQLVDVIRRLGGSGSLLAGEPVQLGEQPDGHSRVDDTDGVG